MEDFRYIPSMSVVSSARTFIKSLCETYGNDRGMAVWDHIRQGLGDDIASDIFLGFLTGHDRITLVTIGDRYIEVIKEIRWLTGWSLKEAKDFCDSVRSGQERGIDVAQIDSQKVDNFLNNVKKMGCTVK